MTWEANEIGSQILAVHAALMPTGPLGEVVLFGGDEHWGDQQESKGNDSWKKARIYDVATHSIVPGQIKAPDSDVFCSHHVFTGDGRLLIAGGTSEFPVGDDGHAHELAFLGHSRCWLYSPRGRRWHETTRLNRNPSQPNEPRSGGRWYPGLVAMGDGSALALFGHLDRNDVRHRNTLPERYSPTRRNWSLLPAVLANPGEPNTGGRRYLMYARAWVLPTGAVFSATPLPVNFASQAGGSDGPHFSTAFNPDTGTYSTPRASLADGVDGNWNLPAVMLPLLPNEGSYNARFLFWSGNQPRWIDTDAVNPAWTNTAARDMAIAARTRNYSNAVLLPTGGICVVGGVHVVKPEDPVREAEIYMPDIDWATNTYGNGGGSWTRDPSPAINTRNYHSTALLLPNGKVWVAGGNVDGDPGNPDTVGVKKIELYAPPYIAVANRITITAAPSMATYREEIVIGLDRPATNVRTVALIRNGSVTHATNNDQRFVALEAASRSGNEIRVLAPPNGNVAPPGYYMLWVVDNAGNPCQVARFVRLAHVSCRVIVDRSTFSQEEVSALGGGSNATFPSALLVDFDGFLASELSGTPTVTLRWTSGNLVAANEVVVQAAGRYFETDPPDPDVPTRISYVFDVNFPTMNAWNAVSDRETINVTFDLGHHRCSAQIELTKSPNPYMIDLDPVAHNPAWLSTDVRVFKVRMGQSMLGVQCPTDNAGATLFIRQIVDRLRSGAATFPSIPADGPTSTLNGSYMTGFPPLPTFNFAVARVRYRATTTVAQNVRCFFRLCNVAATDLSFDTATTYRRSAGAAPVPLLGIAGGQVVAIPFFNAPRINSVVGQAGATSMTTQPLDPNYDIQNIAPHSSGAEVTAYFGVFLDINLPTKRFPISPVGDGPFAEADARPIRDLLRSWHNCLVAEIAFDADPTRPGASPDNSDNLAQRNLAIVGLENPGLVASRTAMHTFELAPSRIKAGQPLFSPFANDDHRRHRAPHPDELFFDWHNLPADTKVTLYFSDVDTADIAALLASRISPPAFEILDKHTIRFRVGDCAWVPIPGGREVRIPALVSIELHDGIIEGERYRCTIRQVSGEDNMFIGSVTIEMPVSKAAFLLPEAEQQLSFMGHIATTLNSDDRWSPIFNRLLPHLSARVDALGGDAHAVHPNPDASGKPYQPIKWHDSDPFPPKGFGSPADAPGTTPPAGVLAKASCWQATVIAGAIALAVVALGLWKLSIALAMAAVLLVVSLFFASSWFKACGGRIRCRLFEAIGLGSTVGIGVLAFGLGALNATVRPGAIIAASVVVLTAVVARFACDCEEGCCR